MRNVTNNKSLSIFTILCVVLLMRWGLPGKAFSQGVDIKLPETVLVKAGSFTMGTDVRDVDGVTGATPMKEWPAHKVTISYDFYIGKYEITNEQYAAFVDAAGYAVKKYWLIDPEYNEEAEAGWNWKEGLGRDCPGYTIYGTDETIKWNLNDDPYWINYPKSNQATTPVVGISWYEAYAYCKWLSAVTGDTFRLPTSAEWEYAARGPESYRFPWGNEYLSNEEMCGEPGSGAKANCWATDEKTTILNTSEDKVAAPVGSYPGDVSPWGVYDMAANVFEPTKDWFKFYDYRQQVFSNIFRGVIDPTGPPIGKPPWIGHPLLISFGSVPAHVYRSYGFSMSGTANTTFSWYAPISYPLRGAHRTFHESAYPAPTTGLRVVKEAR